MPTNEGNVNATFWDRFCQRLQTAALCGVMFGILAIVGAMEKQDTVKAMEQYCDLVAMHTMDPDVGWPDYKNIFKEQCTPEGRLQPQFYE